VPSTILLIEPTVIAVHIGKIHLNGIPDLPFRPIRKWIYCPST